VTSPFHRPGWRAPAPDNVDSAYSDAKEVNKVTVRSSSLKEINRVDVLDVIGPH